MNSLAERYTRIGATYSTIDALTESPSGINDPNQRWVTNDEALTKLLAPRQRLRLFHSAQTDQTPDFAKRLVEWEMARRRGRGQQVQLTCDSWRDEKRQLWQPNWLAQIDLPALKLVDKQWVIATVTFRKDLAGTHAELVLMPPEAFAVQPVPLVPWEYEIYAGAPGPQTGPGGLQGHV